MEEKNAFHLVLIKFLSSTAPSGSGSPHCRGFNITYTHTHTHTLDRTPLDGWSHRRSDLYMTIHNTDNRQTSMPPAGFEPAVTASRLPQIYAFDGSATGIGLLLPFVCFWRNSSQWARNSSFTRFLDRTQLRTTVGRTPLDEWSVSSRHLYLTKHNNHNRKKLSAPVGFENTTPAGERLQTDALDSAATMTDSISFTVI